MTMHSRSFLSTHKMAALSLPLLLLVLLGTPHNASAASSRSTSSTAALEISGWVPYWATAKGTADAGAHLNQITEVNPFGYSVRTDGTLSDTMNLGNSAWQSLFKDARDEDVRIIPTIMWSDTANIYNVLSNPSKRAAHIQSIVSNVRSGDFDGIDIDYEGKTAETRPYFSAFLSELSVALYAADRDLILNCTIEARMPLEARYSGTPPANIEYANDLKVINRVCDRVRVMTYDQQTADVQLNAANRKGLYAPVADTAWVEKVVNYMDNDIDRSKLVIGVPTYGGEYQAMSNVDGSGFTYTKTSSFNPGYALNVARQYKITPARNASGELSFSYVDKGQTSVLPSNSVLSRLAPKGTESANLAAAGALAYSKKERKQAPVTFLTWSDSTAIAAKAKLAAHLGVAGIAIFKFDGSEDPNMWSALAKVARAKKEPDTSRDTSTVVSVPQPTAPPLVVPTPSVLPTTTPNIPTTPTGSVGGSVSGSFTKDLQFGDENADVKRLQTTLITKGYLKATANGYFGPATQAALKAWQSTVGLSATGYFGPQSRAKLGS